jgi:hypothetical protein
MSVSPLAHNPRDRPESNLLVVLVSVLQLSLVVLVWLLALVPAAVLALAVISVKAVRGMLRPAASDAAPE